MQLSIQQAIDLNSFNDFLAILSSGTNPFTQDARGRTILHAMATLKQPNFAERILSRKKTSYDYFIEIRHRLIDIDQANFFTTQDHNGNTALHLAIHNENWHLAQIIGRHLFADPLHSNYRKNNAGLNEFELAISLFGREGRKNEMEFVFISEYKRR